MSFAAMGERYVLFCSIDSDAKGWKHGELRKQKKLTGLPSISFLDAAGTVLLQVPVEQRSVEGFVRTGVRARRYVELRAAARKGDERAAARFLRMQLEERQVSLAEAEKRRRAADGHIDAAQSAALDRLLLHLRINTEIRAKGQKRRHELGPRFYRMLTEGPKPGPDVGRGFWYALLEWAERERKPEAFAVSLTAMRRALEHTDPDAAWVPNLLRRYEAKLKKMRGEAERK